MPESYKLALVTGATSGIGMALCYFLAKQGVSLMITGRACDQLEKLSAELSEISSIKVLIFCADLTTDAGRSIIVAAIQAHSPDLVINNAGFGLYGNSLSYPTEEQLDIIRLNVLAVTEITLESAKALVKANSQGVILNVSSAVDHLVFPDCSVYAASKAFVTQFSTSFYYEMLPLGIHVLTSCPGMVRTNFKRRASKGQPGKTITTSSSKRWMSMSLDCAVKEIWKQISLKKQRHIFCWQTRFALLFAGCLPEKWVARILSRSIRKT